jgi:hypothetical protein
LTRQGTLSKSCEPIPDTRIFQARHSRQSMVPKHDSPKHHPRSLSPAIEVELEQALGALCVSESPETTERLRLAVNDAGRDAREIGLRAEELILLLKSLERRIGGSIPDRDVHGKDALRTRMIHTLLKAYYNS